MRPIVQGLSVLAVTCALLAVPLSASAQSIASLEMSPHPSSAQVARLLRERHTVGQALGVLTQRKERRQLVELDELADTLTAVAVSKLPSDTLRNARLAATACLRDAGIGTDGTPYAGAAARLLRIAESATDVGIRAVAMRALTYQPDRTSAIRMLPGVASSQNVSAHVAVGLLGRDTGTAGRAALRELYMRRAVTQERALFELNGIASHYRWE